MRGLSAGVLHASLNLDCPENIDLSTKHNVEMGGPQTQTRISLGCLLKVRAKISRLLCGFHGVLGFYARGLSG